MAKNTGDPRGPGMPGSGGWVRVTDPGPEQVLIGPTAEVDLSFGCYVPKLGIYVTADSKLQLQAFAQQATTLVLQYTVALPEGRVLVTQESLAIAGGRVQSFFSRQLAEGVLVAVSVAPSAALNLGAWAYASVGVTRSVLGGANLYSQLCGGYATQALAVSWPGGVSQRSIDGNGTSVLISPATPAAGADVGQSVPTNARWRLLSFRGILTTAVAAGNRTVRLAISNTGLLFYASQIGPNQGPSLVTEYDFAPTGSIPTGVPPAAVQIHYDDSLLLRAGDLIQTVTVNIQAADQWGTLVMLLQEWGDGV